MSSHASSRPDPRRGHSLQRIRISTGPRKSRSGHRLSIAAIALLALLEGCGPRDVRSEWAGRYTYSAIGSNWHADAAVKQGYVQIEKDGSFVAVNLPQEWRTEDEGTVFRGRFVPTASLQNRWPFNLLYYELGIVGDLNQRGATIVEFGRKTKSISFNEVEGDWIIYEAPR